MKKEKWLLALAAGAGLAAVTYSLLKNDIPDGAVAVQPFDKNKYLGMWNEIARLPNRIEKNMRGITEHYSLNENGTLKVITKGYNIKTGKWKMATGNIKFAGAKNNGMLKVSYLGPFYLAYNVLDVDKDYQYALVSGSGLDYLWILSRKNTVPDDIKARFLTRALNIGFAVEQLEWV